MTGPLDVLDEATRAALPRVTRHGWRPVTLATLTEHRFSDENWLFERKLDGVRTLSSRDSDGTQLWSRNEKRVDRSYPEIGAALDRFGSQRFVADGEIVAFDGEQTRSSTTCSTCSSSTVST